MHSGSRVKNYLQLIRAEDVMARCAGSPQLTIGLIDGPIDASHLSLAAASIQAVQPTQPQQTVRCQNDSSEACIHGTYVAGILSASRDSDAPGLCPDCRVVSHSLFCEADRVEKCPLVTPDHLAFAIHSMLDAKVQILNLSLGLHYPDKPQFKALFEAYDEARRHGVLVIGAAGNQRIEGVNPLFNHEWVIPVAACDLAGELLQNSNFGQEIASNGLLAPGSGVLSTAPQNQMVQL